MRPISILILIAMVLGAVWLGIDLIIALGDWIEGLVNTIAEGGNTS